MSVENNVFFRSGSNIKLNSPMKIDVTNQETELVSQFRITYKYFLKYTNIEY